MISRHAADVCKFLFYCNYVYLVPFLRYSTSTDSVLLKSMVGVIQDRWISHQSIDHTRLSISVCWCKKARYWSKIAIFFIRRHRDHRGHRRNIVITFDVEKLEWWIYQMVKKKLRRCLLVSIQYTNVTVRRIDRRTPHDDVGRAVGLHA